MKGDTFPQSAWFTLHLATSKITKIQTKYRQFSLIVNNQVKVSSVHPLQLYQGTLVVMGLLLYKIV